MLIKRSNLMQKYADIYSLQSHFAVNKCLRTVASSWIFWLTLNHDARNHESKSLRYPWWWAYESPKHVGYKTRKINKDINQKVASIGNSYCNTYRRCTAWKTLNLKTVLSFGDIYLFSKSTKIYRKHENVWFWCHCLLSMSLALTRLWHRLETKLHHNSDNR
jgi:hypothetical protein